MTAHHFANLLLGFGVAFIAVSFIAPGAPYENSDPLVFRVIAACCLVGAVVIEGINR